MNDRVFQSPSGTSHWQSALTDGTLFSITWPPEVGLATHEVIELMTEDRAIARRSPRGPGTEFDHSPRVVVAWCHRVRSSAGVEGASREDDEVLAVGFPINCCMQAGPILAERGWSTRCPSVRSGSPRPAGGRAYGPRSTSGRSPPCWPRPRSTSRPKRGSSARLAPAGASEEFDLEALGALVAHPGGRQIGHRPCTGTSSPRPLSRA